MAKDDMATGLTCLLPGKVMLEILSRLPVKSLLKFSSVKKSWYNLIKDPRFIKLYSDYSSIRVENDSFLVIKSQKKSFWRTESELSVIRPGSTYPEKLGLTQRGKLAIVGSSNGMVCLTYADRRRFDNEFMVVNLALRQQYQHVCKLALSNLFISLNCGFGFDQKSRDFKILLVKKMEPLYLVYLYSLSSQTWRRIQHPKNFMFKYPSQLYMVTSGSCLYYLAFEGSIVVFDLSSEEFHNIPPPKSSNRVCQQILAWKNESLAAIFRSRENIFPGRGYELWTISPDELSMITDASWEMKMTFTLDGLPDKIFAGRKNGDFPIVCGHKNRYSLLYLKKKKNASGEPELARYVRSCQNISYYMESLEPLLGPRSLEDLKTRAFEASKMEDSKTKAFEASKNLKACSLCEEVPYIMYLP